MPCMVYKTDTGSVFICSSRGGRKLCAFCGRPAGYLCDHPVGRDKTCDKAICEKCKVVVGKDLDYCPDHVAKGRGAK